MKSTHLICLAALGITLAGVAIALQPRKVSANQVRFKPMVMPAKIHDQAKSFHSHMDGLKLRVANVTDQDVRRTIEKKIDQFESDSTAALQKLSAVAPVQDQLAEGEQVDPESLSIVESALEAAKEMRDQEQEINDELKDAGQPEEEEKSFWDHVVDVLEVILKVLEFLTKVFGSGEQGESSGGATFTDGTETGPDGGTGGADPTVAVALNSGNEHFVMARGRQLYVAPQHDLSQARTLNLPGQLVRGDVTLVGMDFPNQSATLLKFQTKEQDELRVRYTDSGIPEILTGTLPTF